MKTKLEQIFEDNHFTIADILKTTHSPDGQKGDMYYRLLNSIDSIIDYIADIFEDSMITETKDYLRETIDNENN